MMRSVAKHKKYLGHVFGDGSSKKLERDKRRRAEPPALTTKPTKFDPVHGGGKSHHVRRWEGR